MAWYLKVNRRPFKLDGKLVMADTVDELIEFAGWFHLDGSNRIDFEEVQDSMDLKEAYEYLNRKFSEAK